MRDVALCVSAWVHDRHQRRFETEPLSLAMLGDATRTAAERERCVQQFLYQRNGERRSTCCIPWGVRRWFHYGRERLLSARFAALSYRWASALALTIADLECRHARNNR